MQYWNHVFFASIGNKLGNYIEADMSFEETGLILVVDILLRLDLQSGLLQELNIDTETGYFIQHLDYEGIPLRFHRCHIYGHGVMKCKIPFKGKFRGSEGDDIHAKMRWVDLATLVLGDAYVEEAKVHGSGKGRKWNPLTTTRNSPICKDTRLSKVQMKTTKACLRSLMLPGKLSTTTLTVVSFLNYANLYPSGGLGVVDISTLGLSIGHPLSSVVAVICKVPTVREYYPPPLITFVFSSEGLNESGFSCELNISSPLIIENVVGTSGLSSLGLPTVMEFSSSLPISPLGLTGPSPHFCSHSSSGNSSTNGTRV